MENNYTGKKITPDRKKSIFKNLWFWIPIATLAIATLGITYYYNDNDVSDNNTSAETTVLSEGTWTVGNDLPENKYKITPETDQSGIITVTDTTGSIVESETLSGEEPYGVPSVTLDLKNEQKINISEMQDVSFTPVETELKTDLTTGKWLVGTDIKPGKYKVTAEPDEIGSVVVTNENGTATTSKIVDGKGIYGATEAHANIEEGQTIEISGISVLHFTEE